MDYNKEIRIRPHHLLCIQGYQGYGYDNKFNQNLKEISSIILKNKNKSTPKLIISNYNDDICHHCPNLTSKNYCKNIENNEDIKLIDNNVMKKLEISETLQPNNSLTKNTYTPKEIFNLINKKISKKTDLVGICDNCSWTDKCLFFNRFE
ncbi:MAG: DUF1284 domain-containing protein [Methanobacteriaceae archaeon]